MGGIHKMLVRKTNPDQTASFRKWPTIFGPWVTAAHQSWKKSEVLLRGLVQGLLQEVPKFHELAQL